MEEIELKKLGLKFARQSEKLDTLVKRGLKTIQIVPEGFTLRLEIRYKDRISHDSYTAKTLCEAIENAYQVHAA